MIYIDLCNTLVINALSFIEIGPPVLEKKMFEGLLPYMGMTAILSCDLDSLYAH